MCFGAGAGGPGVCKADADWKAEAEKACAARMMTLKNITFGAAWYGRCGDGGVVLCVHGAGICLKVAPFRDESVEKSLIDIGRGSRN